MRLKLLLISILINISIVLSAQIPAGYYNSADGLQGETLRQALFLIIKNPNVESYNGLWSAFYYTDKKANGKVWDMYSDVPDGTPAYQYTFYSDQCGNYSGEGSCYNREHSFPKSWFNDATPMYSDLFHLYPTDGSVNGQRSNLPFGEVGSATFTFTNGSKKGPSNYPGYSGIVFEPIDAYKGDFARTYFYMLTCYKDKISNWNCPMLSGSNFSSWSRSMLLEWHHSDPVSQKEIDRNNVVYGYQNNRNPYIDNPIWADAVWDPNYNPNSVSLTKVFFDVYPNPADNFITVNYTMGNHDQLSIQICDNTGRVIIYREMLSDSENISVETLPDGFYFVKLVGNNKNLVRKIVILR